MNRREFLRDVGTGSTLVVGPSLTDCTRSETAYTEPVEKTLVEPTDDARFEPDSAAVAVDESVVWWNVDYATHTVTACEDGIPPGAPSFASGGFTSEPAACDNTSTGDGVFDRGEEDEHAFDVLGTCAYCCIAYEHTGLPGAITVEGTTESEQGGA